MPVTATNYVRHQEGSIARVKRAKGSPDVWVFRWRESSPDGNRVQRKQIVGDTNQYKTKSAAKAATANLQAQINAKENKSGRLTVRALWGHFQVEELRLAAEPSADKLPRRKLMDSWDRERSRHSPTKVECYLDNFRLHILPRWGDTFIDDVSAVDIENWLQDLRNQEGRKFADATKAKLRNQLSALFTHARRHKLWLYENPVKEARQSAKRDKVPDILAMEEMQSIIAGLSQPMHRVAVLVAAVTALRRSEIRGLRWSAVNFDALKLDLKVGIVRRHQTDLKTEESRRGVVITEELANVLREWRDQCAYPEDKDWVFASPEKKGKQPVWLETVLAKHIQPAAKKAGITKQVGWHTFRRSLACILGDKGESIKVVQELLRHTNPSLTMSLYQQAADRAKRQAQSHVSNLFLATAS